ncbi:MAG: dihydroorotate dehydrogenase [Actinomycetia bacterium]|nr:dihydroorotate dehydrogenase [Actinomycetes bacterium]
MPTEAGRVAVEADRLVVQVGSVRLPNPVMVASGTFGFGPEYAPWVDIRRLGGIAVKGVAPEPWPGNPPPRVWETPGGLLNSIGLQNPGVETFVAEDLPYLRSTGVPVVVNIIGHTPDEYARVAARLDREPGIAALEVNISCPNIKRGGIAFGHDPAQAGAVTAAVRAATRLPVWVKLSPNTHEVVRVAEAVAAAGADALTAINTVVGLAIDIERRRPALGGITGGLSGPAVKPVALRVVWEVSQAVGLPVVGMGGIQSARDVVEFLMAGASAVMVGTANFARPTVTAEILDALPGLLDELGFRSVAEVVGAAHPGRRG